MNKFIAFLLAVFSVPAMAEVPPVIIDDNPPPSPYVDNTGIDWWKYSNGYYQLDESSRNNASGLNPGDWRAFFGEESEVLGTSTCNKKEEPGIFLAAEKNGPHCWCKIFATSRDIHKSTPTQWVYRGEFESAYECANLCTYRCAYNFLADTDFRAEILNK